MIRTLLCLFALCAAASLHAQEANRFHLFVGTYTGKESKGIYRFEFDATNGSLTPRGLVAELPNPTFLAIHPNQKFLYAASEVGMFEGKPTGAVAAFQIDAKSGDLKALNKQPSGGGGPCHVVVDRSGKVALAANYGGGSVCSIPIKADGSLDAPASVIQHKGSSVDKARQKGPHAHSINVDPTGRFAMAADLGLDQVLVYKLDPDKGTLTPHEPAHAKVAPGSGPRHFAFHPDGKHAFVINEMLLTITSFRYDADKGQLTEIETISTIPENITNRKGFSTAEVLVHPNGKFVYGSNRGHNSIAIFTFDAAKGKLTHVGNQGQNVSTPRNFYIDPTGKYLLVGNQSGGSITVFAIDGSTGQLTQVGEPAKVPSPVCLRMTPAQ
jgi:6-phosphogluconolactonase